MIDACYSKGWRPPVLTSKVRFVRSVLGWVTCGWIAWMWPAGAWAQNNQSASRTENLAAIATFSVRASEINPRAQQYPELGFVFADADGKPQDLQHAVVNLDIASRGELVIWLMGHNKELFERIASYGQHGIQPHYANRWFGTLRAEDRDSGECLGNIRLEAATGEDYSPLVNIAKPDGLAERSLQLVKWLKAEHPQGEWEQFLNEQEDDLVWDRVILAGISHGSTTAARFAKHQRVGRVVMFSGPRDQYESWQSLPSATPTNRYFGFTHVLDTGWTGGHYCRSWLKLGLNAHGSLVDVDHSQPPFGHSRRLITNGDVGGDANRAHSASVPGRPALKNEAGQYEHEAVWKYLFTHPVELVGQAVPAEVDCRLELK
jgi:hypothetical protein